MRQCGLYRLARRFTNVFPLRLFNQVFRRRAQFLRTSRLLNSNVGALDARIYTGLAWMASAATNLPNLAPIASAFSHVCSIRRHGSRQVVNSSHMKELKFCSTKDQPLRESVDPRLAGQCANAHGAKSRTQDALFRNSAIILVRKSVYSTGSGDDARDRNSVGCVNRPRRHAIADPHGPESTNEVRCRSRLRNKITIRTPLLYRRSIDLFAGCCAIFGTVRGGSVGVGAEE